MLTNSLRRATSTLPSFDMMGLDQAARIPASWAESLNLTHNGSERISATKTGCRR